MVLSGWLTLCLKRLANQLIRRLKAYGGLRLYRSTAYTRLHTVQKLISRPSHLHVLFQGFDR